MRKIATLAGVAALGVAAQAQAYTATANVTFSWGDTTAGTGTTIGWTSNGPQGGITTVANSTYFTTVGGNNSVGYYNSDFATLGNTSPSTFCAAWKAYGCIEYGSFAGVTSAIGNVGPGPSASGTLTITDTTLTGTLSLNAGNDQPAGKAGLVADGFNLRGADGSPFGNSWNGFASATTTLTVNLTGSFSAGAWAITGGTVRFSDSAGIGCQQTNPGTTLCNPSTVIGGFDAKGSAQSWGVDLDGGGTGTAMGEITVKDNAGASILETLSGVLAAASISGGVLAGSGEVRSALGSASGGCSDHIRFDSAAADTSKAIVCGTLTVSELTITGTVTEAVVPVPAAAWLFGSALGLLGWVRRRMAS